MLADTAWEETLLADMTVHVAWVGYREWKQGSALHGWSGDPTAVCLYLVRNGSLEVTLEGEPWRIVAGEAFFVPAGKKRDRIATTTGACWFSLGLHIELLGRLNLAPVFNTPLLWHPSPLLILGMDAIVAQWPKETITQGHPLVTNRLPTGAASRCIVDGLGRMIFGLCWKESLRPSHTDFPLLDAPPWLWTILREIHRQPQLTPIELSHIASIDPSHLRRTFQRYLRQSPQTYLTERRLQVARHLLETTDKTVLTIATEVGLDSLSHFTRLFGERFGTPPARYRQSFRLKGV